MDEYLKGKVSYSNSTSNNGLVNDNNIISYSIWFAITKYNIMGSLYKTEMYFSQLWRLKDKDEGVRLVRFLWEALSGGRLLASHCVLTRATALSLNSFFFFMRTPSLLPIISQRPYLLTQSHWPLEFQYMKFGRTQHSGNST